MDLSKSEKSSRRPEDGWLEKQLLPCPRIRYPRPKCRNPLQPSKHLAANQNLLLELATVNSLQICQKRTSRCCSQSSFTFWLPQPSRLLYSILLATSFLVLVLATTTDASAITSSFTSTGNVSHLKGHFHSLEDAIFNGEALDTSANNVGESSREVKGRAESGKSLSHITKLHSESESQPNEAAKSGSDSQLSRGSSRSSAHEADDLEDESEDNFMLSSLSPSSPGAALPPTLSTDSSLSQEQKLAFSTKPSITPKSLDDHENVIHLDDVSSSSSTVSSVYSTTTTNSSSQRNKAVEQAVISFDFTHPAYNVSIPENSVYKYASPDVKMGIYISDPALTVRFKIVSGDPEKIFKAEAKHVGDFYFLLIRIRYGNNAVLNREYMASYELRVRATITSNRNDAFRFKSKCTVFVTVEDRNDISPIFSENYDVSVPEDVPLDYSVVRVAADDPDIGRNGEIYYSLAETTDLFAIHPTQGIIYTTRALNLAKLLKESLSSEQLGHSHSHKHRSHRESVAVQEHTVHLTVIAKDRGYHSASSQIIESSKAKVNIRITPVNAHLPKIAIKQHSTLATSGLSSSSRRPIYAVVHVTDADMGVYGEICHFDIVSGNKDGLFAISNATSSRDYNIELTRSVSELSGALLRSLPLKLLLRASDCGGQSSNETITILPESALNLGFAFTSDNYYREIRENALPGTEVIQVDLKLLTPSDAAHHHHHSSRSTSLFINVTSSGSDHQFHFSIIRGNEKRAFGISRNGVIYNRLRLDREEKAKYTLVVQAQHELNRIATTMVHIELADENDHYPVFVNVSEDAIVQLPVAENRLNGSVIYRAVATDADIGSNGHITYELMHYGTEELPFAIDANTAEISIIRSLDFESLPRNYHLFVRASDWGEPFRRQSQMLLNITVQDVNDHRPQFEKTNCTAYIPLSTKTYTEIMTFTAVDLDSGSAIRYKMFTPEADKCFQINEVTGTVELICNLKKEIGRNAGKLNTIAWTISISATDGNYFSDSNYLNIVVVGPDSNSANLAGNIPPLISRDRRNIRVECTEHRSRLATTTSLRDSENLLSYEEKEAIKAMQVAQYANEAPVFSQVLTEISIPENTLIGSKIATFAANDSDAGFEGLLRWSLNLHQLDNLADFNRRVYFQINTTTGELFLTSELDFETQKEIHLHVTVCDQSLLNQRCAEEKVKVSVEDVNDNVPKMEHFTFNVSEAAPPHSIVGQIFAFDDDSGDNAALEYFIESNGDHFSIDLFNGTLRLERALDRENVGKYTLYITVTDSGTPALSASSTVTIYVDDVNDNAPEFFQKSYFLKVREDIPVGTRVTRISAFDRDEAEAAQIRYSLGETVNGTFKVDESTGNIRLAKALDYEGNQLYNLTIVATDEGKPSLSSSTFLLIEVEDVNENYHAPKFADFYATASVRENRPVGTVVSKVVATDEDDPSLPLIYQIIGGSGLGRFTIDSSGVILTAAVLDAESNSHFWLTIVAKDRAAVPLTAKLELYIAVEDVNDMPSLTDEPLYQTAVYENLTIGSVIVRLTAHDQDLSAKSATESSPIMYRISNQVPFEVDAKGVIRSNAELDRESVSRYVIDVEVLETLDASDELKRVDKRHDDQSRYIISRTPVIVDVLDVNEFEPKSSLHTYRCYSYSRVNSSMPVCQIIASDRDLDNFCSLTYELVEGSETKHFRLDNSNGIFYPTSASIPKGSYDFIVKISDCGTPALSSTVHVIIRVLAVTIKPPDMPNSKPIIEPTDSVISVSRDDPVGSEVAFIKTLDDDFDKLCSYIIAGNVDNTFAFLDTGALVVAKSLKNRPASQYKLTLMVTDGLDNSTLPLLITVHNDLDSVTPFTQANYTVNVLENITIGADILHLNVVENELASSANLLFSIYSTAAPETLSKFEIESWSGKLKVKSALDYESGKQHVLLIEARSSRKHTSSYHMRSFTKVTINILDVNDQVPHFILPYYEATVLESSSLGTSVLQVQAYDGDFGSNAVLNYSIATGNLDSAFDIEPTLGYVYLKKAISFRDQPEYYLLVRATDNGSPPLSSTANVHILVAVPDNSPPKFEQDNYFVDIREDEKIGTVILSLRMVSKLTTFFEVLSGNDDGSFAINVNNGEIYLRKRLDYERVHNYTLTVSAASLFGIRDKAKIFISVIDVNDNPPYWRESLFEGQLYESMPVNSIVTSEEGSPLVVRAYDRDSMHNSILGYAIVEENARRYFKIEPRTGAVSLIQRLDFEKVQEFSFSVSVSDYGLPSLKATSNALVRIRLLPVNDCPPVFTLNNYYANLLLPTYNNVILTSVSANDCDLRPEGSGEPHYLHYSILESANSKHFLINSTSGQITTATDQFETAVYEFEVTAFDGKHTSKAKVAVHAKPIPRSSLRFRHERYYGTITENSSLIKTVVMPSIDGNKLHEHLIFRIMNPTEHFRIARTSGAILFRGPPVDREKVAKFELAIEVQSISLKDRAAHALIEVKVEDINDNAPRFLGLPYRFVFNSDASKGTPINKVQAVDSDVGMNSQLTYSIISGDPTALFSLNTKSGHLSLARAVDTSLDPLNHTLIVMARDAGEPPQQSITNVTLRMVSGGVPVFSWPVYNVTVSESQPSMVPFLTIKAESPNGRQMFYNIEQGNENEEFALDFSTDFNLLTNTLCMVSVAEKLDRETTSRYTLTVSATDSVSGASSTTSLFIEVEDTNDNHPMFNKFSYNVSVPENFPVGSQLLKVSASDADTGLNGKLQYHIVGNKTAQFYMSPDDGIISLKTPLDYETESTHHFTVMATDYGSPQLTSTAQVWIEVLDINDNPPTLAPTFTTSIDEDIEKGEFVTKITANDLDWSDRSNLAYHIVSGSNMAFVINETSGAIYVRNLKSTRALPYRNFRSLLHEEHLRSRQSTKRHYGLNVSVSDGLYSTTQLYYIDVKPANHYSPKFSRVLHNVAVSEGVSLGEQIFTINATDRDDSEAFGVVEYSILNEYARKYFSIEPSTGRITVRSKLDYEKDDKFYWLVLGAQDKGKRLGVSALRVALTDLNDNMPRFIVKEYKSTVCSNASVGSTILSVMAVDDDEDVENQIKYSIYEEKNTETITTLTPSNGSITTAAINDFFEISSDTGYIYTRANLSALEGKMVQFFVKVTNLNLVVSTTGALKNVIENVVPVTIQVINQCSMQKKEAFLFEVFVKENVERGSVLVNINLEGYKDVDLSIVGFDDPNDSGRFRIDKYGRISLNEPLDREQKAKHILVILLKDKLTFAVEYLYVIINIMDENDCTPFFDSTSYYLSLAENQETGSSIFKVNAIDNDIDVLNNALKYSLEGNEKGTFSIDENSGWIVLTKPLDREQVPNHAIKILVTDGQHSNSTTLHLDVIDVNDNAPNVQKSNYLAAIFENSLLGTVVVTIEASDPDLNSDLRYYITDGDYLNQFSVSSNGDVYVSKSLDREFIDRYSLKILVTDEKYQSETEVVIDVLDVNDNGPVCVKSKYKEMVREDVLAGTYILTVDAIDDDDAENSKLYYTLEGEHKDHFSIDVANGQLKTNAKLDREKQASYFFKAVVYDDKNRQWSCASYIEILLSDVNDEPPKFLSQVNSINIPEDSPVGVILGKVTAIDLDQGANRRVRYELLSPSGEFVINERSGILRLTKSLDRETQSQYNITIMAYDSGASQLNSTTFFVVNVTDVNDNEPEFELKTYTASLNEDAPVGSEVLKVFATSKDTGINAEIKYTIVAGNENDTFSMHLKSGQVKLAKPLDYETTKEYFLTVKAQDEGVPPLSSEVSLRIAVNDINDVRPQFVQRSYEIVIREDAHVGDRILQLVAIDLDSPPNANLTYSFAGDSLSYREFDVDPLLGILTVGKQLDREMMSAYILEVFCTDNGRPKALFSSVLINVEISDYNDNAPLFDKINQTVHLQEGRPVGYTLLNFAITDADSAQNSGPFKLTIVEGNEEKAFSVVDGDASLRSNVVFNHSQQMEYKLGVQVTDSGNPPLSSTTWITVLVIQEPQMPPKLQPLSISVNSLDQFPGGVIGQVNASDEDRFDKLTYSLTTDTDKNIFSIDANDGTLVAFPGSLDAGKYTVNVTVSDGKFTAFGLVDVAVTQLTEAMLDNALVIEVRSISVQEFVTSHMKSFVKILKNLFNVRTKDVIILSLQPAERKLLRRLRSDEFTFGDISIMFAVANMHDGYYTRNWLKSKLAENKFRIENQLGLSFEEVLHKSKCEHIRCSHGDCREDLMLSENEITSIMSPKVSFVSPFHEYRFGCSCHAGFGGKLCNISVNECARSPCPPHKECLPVSLSLGYVCQCPFGKSGPKCNQNAESCHSNERDVSFCYQEFNPISFSGNSYARYGFVRKIDKISLRFRSQQLRAKIFAQQGDHGFSILEITGGYVQYRLDCGEGEGLVRIHNVMVNDGKWHEIAVERKGPQVTVMLDRKHRSGGFAPGSAATCARVKDDLYFGGEVKMKSLSGSTGDEDVLNGFVGCLDNILFNGAQIPFHSTSVSSVVSLKMLANVEFSCNFKADTGACRLQPCQNGGTCNNLPDGGYSCLCAGPRYGGRHCEMDSRPCDSAPCLNGGVCVVEEGTSCEARSSPTCYRCECGGGFTGSNCQHSRYCTPTLCQNGGLCEESSLGPKCHCHAGWHGLYCQTDIDECSLSSPACNPPATCTNLPGTFRCFCPLNSTVPCSGESLLPSNISTSNSPFHVTREELIVFAAIIGLVILLAFLCVCCWNCRNRRRKPKKRTPRANKHQQGDPLLSKHQANAIYENFNGNYTRNSKNSNMEMSTLANNVVMLSQQVQRPTSYGEFFNFEQRPLPSALSADEFADASAAATLTSDPAALSYKKAAPIASVSPQLVEIKRSPKNNLKSGQTHTKTSFNDLRKSSPPNRVSLNDSSDSTVNDEQPHSLTNSNVAEGYHWDNLDLYLHGDQNEHSNLVEFSPVNGDPNNRNRRRQTEQDAVTINSENSQIEVSESQKLFDRCKTRRISKSSLQNKNPTNDNPGAHNGDEHSPLLSASNSTHKMDERSSTGATNSPALEAKVNLSGNLFEYYLPKHDEEWSNGLNQGFKRKNILQYPATNQNGDESKNQNQHHQQNGRGKSNSGGMLTFHRSSLDASADNFSLLTPSSSTSTTPINALVKSSSIGDTTADQCSSSMSSGSSNPSDSKVSPVNQMYANQHLYANTGPNALTSFGYGTVNHHHGRVLNGKDTIVVSKAKDNTTNTKAIDVPTEQTNGKPMLSSTQTTYV